MTLIDPVSAILAALTAIGQLAIFLYLYRDNREPFFGWWILAWGFRLAFLLIQLGPALGGAPRLWTFAMHLASAGNSLSFLVSGLAYRRPAATPHWVVFPAAAAGFAFAAVIASPVGPPDPATFLFVLALLECGAIAGAGVAFWPSRSRSVKGARLLAGSLLIWAPVRLGYSVPLPPALEPALFPASALLQALQMVAVIIVVLQATKQRVEFLKEFNEKLIDGMDLGLALVGPDLTVRHANRWMTERFGDALQGRRCLEVYLARPEQCGECPWRRPSLTGGQLTVDAPGERKFLITCSPLEIPGEGLVLLELLHDITEQEAMRGRLLHSERLATIGQMASRVAHEVRNPLGVMSVNLGLLKDELDPGGSREEALRHITVIKDQIRGLARLVEAYLRFGRLPRPEPEGVDLAEVVEEQVRAIAEELAKRRISVRRDPSGLLPQLWADPGQLGQVFANLFRNAAEAMPEGGELTVRTSVADGRIEVEVTDTGPGVAADEVERIFTPFYTTKDMGNGLGLTLARQIVQEHGGTLTCRSRDSGGAAFLISLPLGGAES